MIPLPVAERGCASLNKAVSGFEPSLIIDDYFSFAAMHPDATRLRADQADKTRWNLAIKKVQERSNMGIFACHQWRRVWSVPSGFKELRFVAEMRKRQPSNQHRSILSIF